MWHLVLLALLLALVVYLFNRHMSPPVEAARDEIDVHMPDDGEESDVPLGELLTKSDATCYGAEWCGFTKKQLSELSDEASAFTYVDCEVEKDRCNDAGINAFPTWTINGKRHEGFMSKPRLQQVCS